MNQVQRSLLAGGAFVVVAGGMLALATMDKKSRIADEDAKEKEKRAFGEVKTDEITALEVTAKGEHVVAVKEGAEWKLTAPIRTAGDGPGLESMASSLANLSWRKKLDDGAMEPRAVDLENPPTTVVATLKNGKKLHVWLGKKNSFDESVYVKAGEDPKAAPIVLVAGNLLGGFQKTLFDLRQKDILPMMSGDAERVEIVSRVDGAATIKAARVVKDGKRQWDDAWTLSAPIAAPADRDEISKLLQALSTSKVLSFVDEDAKDLARFGLEKPSFALTVAGPAKEHAMIFGTAPSGSATKYYVKRADSPVVAEIAEQAFTSMRKPLDAWRDKRLLDFDRDAVRTITAVLPGDATLVLEKHVVDGGEPEWMVKAPKEGRARTWKASSLVYNLHSFKAKSIAKEGVSDLKPFGLDRPSRVVELKDTAGAVLGALLVGREESGDFYVMSRGGAWVGRVEQSKVNELPRGVDDFLESKEDAPPAVDVDEGE